MNLQNRMIDPECFICLAPLPEEERKRLPGKLARQHVPSARCCPSCSASMKSGIACISITEASYTGQSKAVLDWSRRSQGGAKIPYPLMVSRTEVTLFLPDEMVTKFFQQKVASFSGQMLAQSALDAVRVARFMFVPDSFIQERSSLLSQEERLAWKEAVIEQEAEEAEMAALLNRAVEELS